MPDVDHLAVVGGRRYPAGGQQVRVLPRHADRERPVPVDQADDVPVHLAGQHHPDHIHRLGRGDSQARPERRLHTKPVQVRADLRAAAVHHNRAQTCVAQEHNVLREREPQGLVVHGVPAVLDHDDPTVEALEPRQRLDQGRRLGKRASVSLLSRSGWTTPRDPPRWDHVEYAEFSCT